MTFLDTRVPLENALVLSEFCEYRHRYIPSTFSDCIFQVDNNGKRDIQSAY